MPPPADPGPAAPAGPPPGLTPEQRDEWDRCAADPAHFIRNHVWIEDLDTRAWIRFGLWPEQEHALRAWRASRRACTMKARQQGFSWLALGDGLHEMTFAPIAVVLCFSKTDREAMNMIGRRLIGMWKRLPAWMRPEPVGRPSAHVLAFANGSRAMSFPTNAGESYTGTLAIIDEADKIEGPNALDDLLAAVKPTVDASGRLLLISTVEKSKPQSTFKKIFRAGEAGGYRCLFYPWSIRPTRTTEWYEREKAQCLATHGTLDKLWQEYPGTVEEALAANTLDCRFPPQWVAQCYDPLSALDLLGPGYALHHLESPAPALPGLRVYAVPVPGRRYVVGADPAEGNPTSDDSALSVHDADTGEQVAALAGKYDPAVFAGLVKTVSEWYNDAPAMVERNNHGHAVILWLKDNAHRTHVLKGPDGRPGWQTTTASKALLYDDAAEVLRQGACRVRDPGTRDQLLSIEGATLRAPEDEHDDQAVAFVLALAAAAAAPRGTLGVY